MGNIRENLIGISLQSSLSDKDCAYIGVAFNRACDALPDKLAQDCLDIIKLRLWKMPIESGVRHG